MASGFFSQVVSKMPIFQPSKRDAIVVFNSQVLDLKSAVKDGIYGVGVIGADVGEKSDLKKMIEELDLSEVPSVFVCPISLEPMQDPVTLCTGQTYERSDILKWLSLGHYTCPTTMQELWDDSVTPNRTLYQLIYTWFSQKYLLMKKRAEDVQGRTSDLIESLKKVKGQARVQALKELQQLVVAHAAARKTVVNEGGVAVILSLLGPFTTHAVGSEAIGILVNLTLDSDAKSYLMQPVKVSLMVDMLNEGSIQTKINCAILIKKLMEEKDFRTELILSHSLLVGLMRLMKDKRSTNGILPGLSLLRSMCSHKEARSLIVMIGTVPQLVQLLPSLDPECLELALFILDLLSTLTEGQLALKDCPNTVPNMSRLLMGVSESCTQYALSILCSACKVAPEESRLVAVNAGLPAKLLLVIQSGCNPVVKQQSAELLKLCSLNYTDTIFISKCKIRTFQ